MFLSACLIQWLERSKSCPQCRNKCTQRNIFRIFFNNTVNLDNSQTPSTATLMESVDNMTLQIREKDLKLKAVEEKEEKTKEIIKKKE